MRLQLSKCRRYVTIACEGTHQEYNIKTNILVRYKLLSDKIFATIKFCGIQRRNLCATKVSPLFAATYLRKLKQINRYVPFVVGIYLNHSLPLFDLLVKELEVEEKISSANNSDNKNIEQLLFGT